MIERRVQRSEKPTEAARLFLSHLASERSCKAIAVATDHGLLITGVGEGVDLDWLAAIASIGVDAPRFVEEAAGEPLSAFSLRIGGHALHVASVGEPLDVAACEAGLQRICAPLFDWAA
jgi:hypothetical protein